MGVNCELLTPLTLTGTGCVTIACLLITPERNKLQGGTIEALECLKAWFDKGLIKREGSVH
jgi:hypothetical protein